MKPRIFIMGAGRVGLGFTRAFRAAGVDVVGVHGRRNPGGQDGVTVGPLPPSLSEANVVLVTVRDAQIDDAVHELLGASLAHGAVIMHASGAAEPESLTVARNRGHPAGTFHP